MENTRNTKQKLLIMEVLKKEKNHPTINDIYLEVLKYDDTVGQATVYRNVNKLIEEGKLKKIPTEVGYRYDVDCNNHCHLICKKCGRIMDVYDDSYSKLMKKMEGEYHIKIIDNMTLFEGICDKCNE